jgi:hypothetical protein
MGTPAFVFHAVDISYERLNRCPPHFSSFWDIRRYDMTLLKCSTPLMDDNYFFLDNVIAMTGKPNCFIGRGSDKVLFAR